MPFPMAITETTRLRPGHPGASHGSCRNLLKKIAARHQSSNGVKAKCGDDETIGHHFYIYWHHGTFDFGALQFFFMQLKHLPMGLFSAFLKPFKASKSWMGTPNEKGCSWKVVQLCLKPTQFLQASATSSWGTQGLYLRTSKLVSHSQQCAEAKFYFLRFAPFYAPSWTVKKLGRCASTARLTTIQPILPILSGASYHRPLGSLVKGHLTGTKFPPYFLRTILTCYSFFLAV